MSKKKVKSKKKLPVKKNSKSSKKVVKKVKKVKAAKLSTEDVLVKLTKCISRMVSNTMRMYQNGPLASIFNEQEIYALAQDTALEVARRVQLFNKNPRTKGGVNPKGAEAYFCRAFINQSQKMYEKFAKTDTRAGVQTIGSDEAMAVASNKNFVNPENDWLIKKEFEILLKELSRLDAKHNDQIQNKALSENRRIDPAELQHSALIIEKSLEGYEANEIREMLKLSEADYNRHRRAALDLAKEKMPSALDELMPHLDQGNDLRLYTREVKKRKKSKNYVPNYSLNKNFYLQTSKVTENQYVSSLFVRIDVMDGDDRVKSIPSETVKLEEIKGSISENPQVRQQLWSKTQNPEILKKIEFLGQKLINKK